MQLLQGDCLELMKEIPDKSIDMILCDLPYGTTTCKWDTVIPLEKIWVGYKRIIKDNGAIVLFGLNPFSANLIMSNPKMYRYTWIWQKSNVVGFFNAKKMPLRTYEEIMVFYKKLPTYNPQFTQGKPYISRRTGQHAFFRPPYSETTQRLDTISDGRRYPKDIIQFSNSSERSDHPTQKPVALLEYLIKTYTNPGELVLDNCMGSGSTGVACVKTGREFIGMELDEKYYNRAVERINEAQQYLEAV